MCRWTLQDHRGPPEHPRDTNKYSFREVLPAPNPPCISGYIGYEEVEFSWADGMPMTNKYCGGGVGDDAKSWGINSSLKCKWHDGSSERPVAWAVGDAIGLVVSIGAGGRDLKKMETRARSSGVLCSRAGLSRPESSRVLLQAGPSFSAHTRT